MSSNPFRRSQLVTSPPPPAPAADNTIPAVAEDGPAPSSPSRKKSVRITSPPQSPPSTAPEYQDALLERVRRGSHEGSPPPSVTQDAPNEVEDGDDPFERDLSDSGVIEEDAQVVENTRRNSELASPPPTGVGAPFNPFSKTLASMEGNHNHAQKEVHFEETPTERTRASMDVDAFTRMLMTGSATPSNTNSRPKPPSVAPAAGPEVERQSSAPPSPAAQPAVVRAPGGVSEGVDKQPNTLPAQYDGSAASSFAVDTSKVEKRPPPPPKHRHGKPVNAARTPQTVSFDDFNTSVTSPSTEMPPPVSRAFGVEANKPLPPTPSVASSANPMDATDTTLQAPLASPPVRSPSNASQHSQSRKGPPPPPLARRQSQLRSSGTPSTRSRSNSNLTINSQAENNPAPSQKSAPPPPPPARRSGAAPSTGTTARSNSQQPSTASTGSLPPLPPPPRRGSSKSSLDAARPSAEVLAEARRTSSDSRRWSRSSMENRPSSLRNEAAVSAPVSSTKEGEVPTSSSGDADVLAEMERFQREIDALRLKQGNP